MKNVAEKIQKTGNLITLPYTEVTLTENSFATRLERVAEPKDVSSVVEFLLSPGSDFISGEVIKIDGGLFNQSI